MPKHYIITNRSVTTRGNTKDFYKVNSSEYLRIDGNEEAKDDLRYGTVEFKSARSNRFKVHLFPDLSDEEMESYVHDAPVKEPLGSEKVFSELYESGVKTKDREDILVYIHGYNADLTKALKTLQQLHYTYVENPDSPIKHLVLFTWPAKRKTLKYRDDARDAKLSGYALARSMAKLRDLFVKYFTRDKEIRCRQKLHLMCHSMGNRVLESMFLEIVGVQGQVNNVFGEVVLVGADIDYDAIHEPKPLSRIIDIGERVHIYFHNQDAALGISELTKNAYNRLGRWGAKNSLRLSDGIFQADVSDIEDETVFIDSVTHHWYHITSPSVVSDISDVFHGKTSIFSAQF